MRIGYLAAYSEAEVEFARAAGFGSLELLVGPGAPLDPTTATDSSIQQAREALAEADIEVSALGWYPNMLEPEQSRRAEQSAFFRRLFELAEQLGVQTLCTFAGRVPDLDIPENIPHFIDVWAPLAKEAEDRGLRIGFENCPMFHTFPFRGINLAYTPRAWDLMFEAVPSPVLGLEYDPSHLIALEIDYLWALREYGSKVFHVHAKDAERLMHNVRKYGHFEPGGVRDRVPGMGASDWGAIISTLHEVGYTGNLDIEGRHDPIYHAARENEGLVIALRHLSQFIANDYIKPEAK